MNLCLSVNYSETQNMTNSTLSNFVQSNVKIMPNLENLPNAMLQIQNISIENANLPTLVRNLCIYRCPSGLEFYRLWYSKPSALQYSCLQSIMVYDGSDRPREKLILLLL